MPSRRKKGNGICTTFKRVLKLQNHHDLYTTLIVGDMLTSGLFSGVLLSLILHTQLTVQKYCEKYLDLLKTPTVQKEAIMMVKNKVVEVYPDTFNSDDGLEPIICLEKYIKYYHTYMRGKKNSRAPQQRKSRSYSNPPTGQPYVLLPNSIERNPRSVVPNAPQTEDSLVPRPVLGLSPAFVEMPSSRIPAPITTRKIKFVSDEKKTMPTLYNSYPQSLPDSSHLGISQPSSSSSHGHQISRIHVFLDSCIPSMSRYLQRFIDFGIDTQEHLLAISMWTDGEIDLLLKTRLPLGPEDTSMSDMNVLCLRRHFRTYFFG